MKWPSAAEIGTSGRSNAAPGSEARGADLDDPRLYFNRDLSWLAFIERVLAHAHADIHPLLERVAFLAVAARNLDEFFMGRVATLMHERRARSPALSADGLTIQQQVQAVRARAHQLLLALARCWHERLQPSLAQAGLRFLDPARYTPDITRFVTECFATQVYPVLTPLAFEPGRPFPHVSNGSKTYAVVAADQGTARFARVEIPALLPRFIPVPSSVVSHEGTTFLFLEDVIRQQLAELFPGVEVRSAHLFRILREDLDLRDENEDVPVRPVNRPAAEPSPGPITLLQADAEMPPRVLELLVENFAADKSVVVSTGDRQGLAYWHALTDLPRPDLKHQPVAPRALWRRLDSETIFDRIKFNDQLVHHPFDSFSAVETFLDAASDDQHVLAIKISLSGTGELGPMVDRLIKAAGLGKQVTALVASPLRRTASRTAWVTRLEDAGVLVAFGRSNLPTHCGLLLIVRQEDDRLQRYVHVNTGTYERQQTLGRTDLGLFTADDEIGADASDLFNYLTGCSHQTPYRALLVAPFALRDRFAAFVEREIHHARSCRPSGIIIKNNAIDDRAIIQLLYRASRAGVRVDAIVRGICCLKPGVEGVSDLIRVRSILGRFLEHSRVYSFENGGDPEIYIGSADLLQAHLDRRVDLLCPVFDPDLRHYLRHKVLQAYLRDDTGATALHADGRYERIHEAGTGTVDSQRLLMSRLPPEA